MFHRSSFKAASFPSVSWKAPLEGEPTAPVQVFPAGRPRPKRKPRRDRDDDALIFLLR